MGVTAEVEELNTTELVTEVKAWKDVSADVKVLKDTDEVQPLKGVKESL